MGAVVAVVVVLAAMALAGFMVNRWVRPFAKTRCRVSSSGC